MKVLYHLILLVLYVYDNWSLLIEFSSIHNLRVSKFIEYSVPCVKSNANKAL